MAFTQDSLYGSFIPTTKLFDEQNIRSLDIKDPKFKELIVQLYQAVNDIALVLNVKDTGYYPLEEFLSSQLFFPDPTITPTASNVQTPDFRQAFRRTFNMGALTNGGTTTIAHDIDMTASIKGTRLYGVASKADNTSFIPVPYTTDTTTEAIKLEVTKTHVIVTTYDNKTAWTNCIVVFEYLKN